MFGLHVVSGARVTWALTVSEKQSTDENKRLAFFIAVRLAILSHVRRCSKSVKIFRRLRSVRTPHIYVWFRTRAKKVALKEIRLRVSAKRGKERL